MKEIFAIYNKATGFIEGGTGRVNRSESPDGSTVAEQIPDILAKDPNMAVVYLPNQPLPDPGKHKVVGGEMKNLTKSDFDAIAAAKPKSEIELLKARVAALEAK